MPDRSLVEQLDQAIESVLAGAMPVTGGDGELAALAEIATHLRYAPDRGFQDTTEDRIAKESSYDSFDNHSARRQRRDSAPSPPSSFMTKAPELVDFMKSIFGAEELKRNTAGEAYGFYSEARIGDSVIMIGGGAAASRGNLPAALHVYVDDCDAAYRRALEAGAVTLMGVTGEPADRPYGERSAFVEDAFGNYWYIATRLASAPPAEGPVQGLGTVRPHVHPASARKYIDFLSARSARKRWRSSNMRGA